MTESARRYHFVDLLKAYAVLMMVQGHLVEALLNPADKGTSLYQFLHFLRGLTAPAFLMGAGFGLFFSFVRKSEKPTGLLIRQKIQRVLPIVAIGYFLHLPYLSAAKIFFTLTGDDWQRFLQCDILQTIGFTVLILQIVFTIIRHRAAITAAALLLIIPVLALTPAMKHFSGLPLVLNQIVSGARGSPFPVFPFSAYLLAGVALGGLFLILAEKFNNLVAGAGLITAGIVLATAANLISDPFLFYVRTGLLTVLCGMLVLLGNEANATKAFFINIGKESLLVYVVHIMIVYGSVLNKGLVYYFGGRLNAVPAAILAIALIVAMVLLAMGWSRVKAREPQFSRALVYGLVAYLVIKFAVGQ